MSCFHLFHITFLQDGNCTFKRQDVGADDVGYVDLPVGNETSLMMAVASVGEYWFNLLLGIGRR